jgi:hypothetical protein
VLRRDIDPFIGRAVRGVVCIEGVGDDGDYRTFVGYISEADATTVIVTPLKSPHPLGGDITYEGDGRIGIGQIVSLTALP